MKLSALSWDDGGGWGASDIEDGAKSGTNDLEIGLGNTKRCSRESDLGDEVSDFSV